MHPTNAILAERLRSVRADLFGEDGEWAMAEALSLPARAWRCYEAGAGLPGHVLLAFIERTGADPHWLLTGEGAIYLEPLKRKRMQPGSESSGNSWDDRLRHGGR